MNKINLKQGFSKLQTGILLVILSATLFFFSYSNIITLVFPGADLNNTNIFSLQENQVVSIAPQKSLGVDYYDTSLGLYKDIPDAAKVYSQAYLVLAPNSNSPYNFYAFSLESSDKSVIQKLEQDYKNKICSSKYKGRLKLTDENRQANQNYLLAPELNNDISALPNCTSSFYIYIDNPIDDILMFSISIISIILSAILLIPRKANKK